MIEITNPRLQSAVCHSSEGQNRQTGKWSLFANLPYHHRQTGKHINSNELRAMPSVQFAEGFEFAGERANYPQFAGGEGAPRAYGGKTSAVETVWVGGPPKVKKSATRDRATPKLLRFDKRSFL